MDVPVVVSTKSDSLRRGLLAALDGASAADALQHDGPAPGAAGDVLVAPATECSPADCERLTNSGRRVVILAAFPRDDERERYLGAGAIAYVPMTGGRSALLDAVARAVSAALASVGSPDPPGA